MKFFSKFKEIKALIKNHIENKIKTFRSDNGGEFTSNEFKALCKDSRIKRDLSTPYNPQQDGIAERNNRTIMEAARAMLHDQDIPMHLWAEATRTMVYVQNHTPHRVLENKTPEEVFFGKKPEVSHLRIFDYPMYIHILKEKRTKLDPSRKKGIFVGYSERSKAYRIYFPRFKNIDIIRDVTFDEDSSYIKSRKRPTKEPEETKVPRIQDTTMKNANQKED